MFMSRWKNWLLVAALLLVTNAATGYFCIFGLGRAKPPASRHKNIIVIVAVADDEFTDKTDEAYFREQVFGQERSPAWPYVSHGSLLGHTGFFFSQHPMEKKPLALPLLW